MSRKIKLMRLSESGPVEYQQKRAPIRMTGTVSGQIFLTTKPSNRSSLNVDGYAMIDALGRCNSETLSVTGLLNDKSLLEDRPVLDDGDIVTFEIEQGLKGPAAANITVLEVLVLKTMGTLLIQGECPFVSFGDSVARAD